MSGAVISIRPPLTLLPTPSTALLDTEEERAAGRPVIEVFDSRIYEEAKAAN
jgi:hypothetical protein